MRLNQHVLNTGSDCMAPEAGMRVKTSLKKSALDKQTCRLNWHQLARAEGVQGLLVCLLPLYEVSSEPVFCRPKLHAGTLPEQSLFSDEQSMYQLRVPVGQGSPMGHWSTKVQPSRCIPCILTASPATLSHETP